MANTDLATLQDAASLVEKYALRLGNDKRAQEFSTYISIMAQKEPKIKRATPESIVTAMMACVSLDLMPNTPQQHAYIIPYKNGNQMEVQFQLGYKGLVELAYRGAQILSINAELVFEGDEFKQSLGSERRLIHYPGDADRSDYSKVTHAYMTAKLINGEVVFEVMSRTEIDKIQESAKAKSTDAPWAKWPEAMAKKTVLKRGIKLLPTNKDDTRLSYATAIDSWAESGRIKLDDGNIVEATEADQVAANEERRAKMLEAEAAQKAERAKLESTKHEPVPVEAQTESLDDIPFEHEVKNG